MKEKELVKMPRTWIKLKPTFTRGENIMAKMSQLNIEQTNRFIDALDTMAQYIDTELLALVSPISLMHGRLMYLAGIIEGYKEIIREGE